ncbi:hypothetical protein [Acidisoma silvae]|uniref:Uncharacterized protein n=1 Tax=Acidisoma silvae TaxID=2802396 RepID=A0A963YNT7_9PROT|nr:hypothetical protein [Acidisoma silvae]MCB8873972.1 hypothetical protein [Acidisoma silvae]
MISQTALYCAAAALAAALYHHGLRRLALVVRRKFRISTTNLAMLPLFLATAVLLCLEIWALQTWAPDFAGAIGSATFLGLAIGSLVPISGTAGSSFGTGFGGDDDSSDDLGDDGGGY